LYKKSKKYFNKEIKHTYFKITFKNDCSKCHIKCGEFLDHLLNMKIKSVYYINSKNVGKNPIAITTTKNGKEENKIYNIDEDYSHKEFEKSTNFNKINNKRKVKRC